LAAALSGLTFRGWAGRAAARRGNPSRRSLPARGLGPRCCRFPGSSRTGARRAGTRAFAARRRC